MYLVPADFELQWQRFRIDEMYDENGADLSNVPGSVLMSGALDETELRFIGCVIVADVQGQLD